MHREACCVSFASTVGDDALINLIPGFLIRLPEVADYLRTTFPSVPIIWRTPHDIPLRDQPQPRMAAVLGQLLMQVFAKREWEGKVTLDESSRWFVGTGAVMEPMSDRMHPGMMMKDSVHPGMVSRRFVSPPAVERPH